jgi:hypothetical protein
MLACSGGNSNRGGEGEQCYSGGTCNGDLVCVEDTCQELVPGTEGAPCYPNNTCNDGLDCVDGTCLGMPDAGVPTPPAAQVKQVIGPSTRDADVLFVIDNSGSMREEQDSLAANFNSFINVLENLDGGLPNLHIGIVSTDMGAGPFGIMGCTGLGDNGILQTAPSGACSVPDGSFIEDIALDGGGRSTNYSGTLADNFACIAKLGTTGCGFEQHLESMRRALNGSNPQNAGFLRSDALLAVIFVTDEDDCSTENLEMFDSDPARDNIDSDLGFLSSFRCFEFGVACTPDTPRTPGPRQDCVPRNNDVPHPSGARYMYEVEDYVDFLRGLKQTPGRLVVAGLIGNPTPVTVGTDDTEPVLEPSCITASGEADPAIRLDALGSYLGMGAGQTICNEDLSGGLTAVASEILARMSGSCLVEVDDTSSCVYADVAMFGTTEEQVVQPLPLCTASPTGPCIDLQADSPDCTYGSGTKVTVDRRGTSAPSSTVVVATCAR